MNADVVDVLLDDLAMACADAYETVDDAPPAPGPFVKLHGSAVWDQPQVAIACSGIRPVKPFPSTDPGPNRCLIIPAADLVIEVVRAGWPGMIGMVDGGGAPPDNADLHAATALLARDAMTLFVHISQRALAGDLFPTLTDRGGRIGCGDVTIGSMLPLQPAGGFAGWRWSISVGLKIP